MITVDNVKMIKAKHERFAAANLKPKKQFRFDHFTV